jgi:hypothetical protein
MGQNFATTHLFNEEVFSKMAKKFYTPKVI